jgi:hypothetical protein
MEMFLAIVTVTMMLNPILSGYDRYAGKSTGRCGVVPCT